MALLCKLKESCFVNSIEDLVISTTFTAMLDAEVSAWLYHLQANWVKLGVIGKLGTDLGGLLHSPHRRAKIGALSRSFLPSSTQENFLEELSECEEGISFTTCPSLSVITWLLPVVEFWLLTYSV